MTGHSAITTLDSTDTPSSITSFTIDPDVKIIETKYFDVSLPIATVNKAHLPFPDTNYFHDIEPDEVITEHLQYLSYQS